MGNRQAPCTLQRLDDAKFFITFTTKWKKKNWMDEEEIVKFSKENENCPRFLSLSSVFRLMNLKIVAQTMENGKSKRRKVWMMMWNYILPNISAA